MAHVRDSLRGPDGLGKLLEDDKATMRNVLWQSFLAKYGANQIDETLGRQHKRYLLKRLHNRISRILPPMLVFVLATAGIVLCLYIELSAIFNNCVCRLDLWRWMKSGERDLQGRAVAEVG